MSQRVLSTQDAVTAATKLKQLLSGSLTTDLNQLQQMGATLSNKDEWDGPKAQQFRGDWPKDSQALKQAITSLEQLQATVQQILQNIMKAG